MKKIIKLIVFDFDGVMTDNRVLVNEKGEEAVWVNRSDGLAVEMIRKMGIPMLILSTETNPIVSVRAKKLNLPVLQAVSNKKEALLDYCNSEKIDLTEVMYVGNDINDLPAMELVGYKVVPSDAYEEVKQISDIVLSSKGGGGVVRELADLIKNGGLGKNGQ